MFYVEKWHREKKKDLTILHLGPTLIVFLAFLGITIWSWLDARQTVSTRRTQLLQLNIDTTQAVIQDRLATYEDILRAGTGLIDASNDVSRSEWSRFITIFELSNRYPGIRGVGYIALIEPSELERHSNQVKSEGYPDYSIYPVGDRPLYSSIVYLEPLDESNKKAIGFDMLSGKTRKEAMDLARDSGTTTISSIVNIIQNEPSDKQPGFLMFRPVYKKNTLLNSQTDRRAGLIGYVYAPFNSKELLKEVTAKDTDPNFGFQLYESFESPESLLYESTQFSRISGLSDIQRSSQTFIVNNKAWTLSGVIDPAILSDAERNRPTTVLWGGILFTTFIAGFIYLLLLNRTRDLSIKEKAEIQSAKDELLALASHQLRTPATGVKQYIGMIREGYAGKVNREQRTYLDKAYESNERQLQTINQMLFVARSDAGNIKLDIVQIDVVSLVRDVLDEQKSFITEKQQKLLFKKDVDSLHLDGDTRYLRMAIENIISNASKYTPTKGTVAVTIKSSSSSVSIIIKDTGVGVSQQDYPLLFQKFSRIPNELTNKVSGSGIGLYLSKTIVEAHQGSISFTSSPGQGSTVVVKLPFVLTR